MKERFEDIYNSIRHGELANRLQKRNTISEINYLYNRIDLDEPKKSINKKMRVESLAYFILNMPHKIIDCLTPGEILWLNELAEQKVMSIEKSSVEFLTTSLSHQLKLFDIFRVTDNGEQLQIAVIYDDTLTAFSEALKKAALDIKHRTPISVLRTYVSGLLNLCGFLSLQEILLTLASETKLPKTNEKEIHKVFNGLQQFSKFDDVKDMPDDIWVAGNCFINYNTAPDIVAKREKHTLNPTFEYRTVIEAAMFPMPQLPAEIVNPLAKRLRKYFASEREAIGFITKRWLLLQAMPPMDFIKSTIETLGDSDLSIDETMAIVQEMNNTLPRFEFYGHSSVEASSAMIKPGTKDKPRIHLGELFNALEGIDEEKVSEIIANKLLEEFNEYIGDNDDIRYDDESESEDLGRYIARNSITPWVNTNPKIGRNDPCPCGSGKKYKNCCGKNK